MRKKGGFLLGAGEEAGCGMEVVSLRTRREAGAEGWEGGQI